jgi:tetratricopeptide (TPR) repeat protein
MLVTLPLTLLIFDWWPLSRTVVPAESGLRRAITWRQAVLEKAPLFAVASIGIVMQLWVQRASWRNEPVVPVGLRIENAIVAPVIYLRKMLWPTDLAAFYPYPANSYAPSEVMLAGVVLSAITIVAVRAVRTRPYLLAGWAWYLITLAPVSGVFQVLGGQAYADRYTYVPLIGIFWIVAWGLGDALRLVRGVRVVHGAWSAEGAKILVVTGAGVWLAALCWLTSRQIPKWREDLQLWTHALTVNSENYFALNNLGVALERRNRIGEAIQCYERSVNLKSDYSKSHNNLGQLFEKAGRLPDAARQYHEAINLDPGDAQAWINLARALGKMGQWRQAADAGRHASTLTPNDPGVRVLAGMTLVYAGDFQGASEELKAATQIDPKMAQAWYGLGTVQMIDGEEAQSLDSFARAAGLSPDSGSYAFALAQAFRKAGKTEKANQLFQRARIMDAGWIKQANDLAWTLATSPDDKARNGRYALWLASQICQVVDDQNAACMETLAAAQAEVGDFTGARATLTDWLARFGTQASPERRETIDHELRGYERREPYRVAGGRK